MRDDVRRHWHPGAAALLSFALAMNGPMVAMAGVMSIEMLQDRATAAISAMDTHCTAWQSRRTRSEPTGLYFRCADAGEGGAATLWLARIVGDEVVGILPVNQAALRLAPPAGTAAPQIGDPRLVKIVTATASERDAALKEAQDLFR